MSTQHPLNANKVDTIYVIPRTERESLKIYIVLLFDYTYLILF